MANALAEVEETFLSLDGQYSELRLACRNDTERTELELRYSKAEQNYDACANEVLEDDDAQVAALCTQLKSVNAQIDKATEEMGQISKVLNMLDQAISIGGELLAKVGV